MANPKYSILLKVAIADGAVTVDDYTSKVSAEADYVTAVNSGDYDYVALLLEQLPSKDYKLPTNN